MELYKIYSAGGGGGDWNGVSRVFENLPLRAKENILLKYGDVFLNHASSNRNEIIRSGRQVGVLNLREWFFQKTGDPDVYNIDILLDTGAAKITSWIQADLSTVAPEVLFKEFDQIIRDNNIIDHYAKVISASKVNKAISLDIPNPFKMRAFSVVRKLNVVNHFEHQPEYIKLCADYTNELYKTLVQLENEEFASNVLMATLDGAWDISELNDYMSQLNFIPKNLAFGGLIGFRGERFINCVNKIKEWLDNSGKEYLQIHFLGCGGVKNSQCLLDAGFSENCSADVSTPINRAVDGSKTGKYSKYYAYNEMNKKIEIREDTVPLILKDNIQTNNPLYSQNELKEMLDRILEHQSGKSSEETYNARAKLIFHNYDAYQHYCNK